MRMSLDSPARTLADAPPSEGPKAALRPAQAAHVRAAIVPFGLGLALACAWFAALWWGRVPEQALAAWVAIGTVAFLSCVGLQRRRLGSPQPSASEASAARFLWLGAAAAALGALLFAWGWLAILPGLPFDEQMGYLIASLALLGWALHVFSPFLPACHAFALISLVPGVLTLASGAAQSLGAAVGLAFLGALALLHAVRLAQAFSAAQALQDRVYELMNDVTATRDETALAIQAKSRFLASVSHDLRQPMQAINLYLASLAGSFRQLRGDPSDEQSAASVDRGIRSLQESTQYLNGMFESLLDISRLNAGFVAVEIRYTTLHRMLTQLDADCRKQAAADGLHFDLQLPAQVHLMEVETDPALLERLLRNLLVNAFRYCGPGRGVRLSVVRRGKTLDFRVVDSGPGIEPAMRQRVFEEFFQVPGSQPAAAAHAGDGAAQIAQVGRGIGLGLSISTRLAEKLNSRVRLHSWVGHGSVFAVRQPMRIALRPQTDQLPARPRQLANRFPPGLFLAFIDDDPEIRRSMHQMLEQLGAEVFSAESAAQAVSRLGLQGRVPDLVLSDYRLGPENGLQAIALLREEFNLDIPAILITGDTSPERLAEFRASGLRVLYKPIAGEPLVAAILEELRAAAVTAP